MIFAVTQTVSLATAAVELLVVVFELEVAFGTTVESVELVVTDVLFEFVLSIKKAQVKPISSIDYLTCWISLQPSSICLN